MGILRTHCRLPETLCLWAGKLCNAVDHNISHPRVLNTLDRRTLPSYFACRARASLQAVCTVFVPMTCLSLKSVGQKHRPQRSLRAGPQLAVL